MIQPTPLLQHPIRRPARGFLDRVYPLWTEDEVLKHLHPIRNYARKAARSSFDGSGIVAASIRIERAGLPESYRLPDTARQYAIFQNCEQLIAILASRMGAPKIAPVPPLWPLLALILFEWRGSTPASRVLTYAARMGLSEEVQRGLVIVAYLFPELESWLGEVHLRIPLWERVLAIPLAARKLVLLQKTT